MAIKAFEPKFMKVGVLTAALQELTPREVRDPDPDRAIEEWVEFARELGASYIQLSAAGLAAGRGMWMMSPEQLDRYRRAVADEHTGAALERIVAQLARKHIEVGGHGTLKTVPRGYPRDHARAQLLRHKGLTAWKDWPVAAWLGTATARRRIVEFLHDAQPLADWLTGNVGAGGAAED